MFEFKTGDEGIKCSTIWKWGACMMCMRARLRIRLTFNHNVVILGEIVMFWFSLFMLVQSAKPIIITWHSDRKVYFCVRIMFSFCFQLEGSTNKLYTDILSPLCVSNLIENKGDFTHHNRHGATVACASMEQAVNTTLRYYHIYYCLLRLKTMAWVCERTKR